MQIPSSSDESVNPADWLQRAETAVSLDEALDCLRVAVSLAPSDPAVQQKTYQLIRSLLKQDPNLVYLDETSELYLVGSSEHPEILVPKERSVPETYTATIPPLVRSAQHWLWLSFLGLPLAGLGAIIFAPLAARSAIALNFQPTSLSTRTLSLVLLMVAGGLWLVGLLLGVILLMHLV